jgi:putative DNA-invertase from lambdoid prophage Rac
MAVFAYLRVSTTDQTTSNQKLEIQNAGVAVDYWFSESISGSVCASERPEFTKLLAQIRDGETLIVSKLDRLGRSALDVQSTVKALADRNIKVQVLALGNTDLTSPTGKLLLTMLSAVAEMERDLLIERTQAGLARAKSEGKTLGRPTKLATAQIELLKAKATAGANNSALF